MSKIRASNLNPDNIVSWFAVNGSDQLNDVQKALILAKLGVRPRIDKRSLITQRIIITWKSMTYNQIQGATITQVASIIKKHKQLTRLELFKACERSLDTSGLISHAINNSLKILKQRNIVSIKHV